ncbi:uncharacterized protein [Diabrotica undecimpunctata]|uniref:uncharacterized protein n=1 Tax=Diabrotica undecimpunctata TaxID=50387 RepID=UPI003B63C1C4
MYVYSLVIINNSAILPLTAVREVCKSVTVKASIKGEFDPRYIESQLSTSLDLRDIKNVSDEYISGIIHQERIFHHRCLILSTKICLPYTLDVGVRHEYHHIVLLVMDVRILSALYQGLLQMTPIVHKQIVLYQIIQMLFQIS